MMGMMILFTNFVEAQYSVHTGLNSSIIRRIDRNSENTLSQNGFHIGVIYTQMYNSIIGFQVGVVYTTKGYKVRKKSQLEITLEYLDLPMGVVFALGPVHMTMGPYVSFLKGARLLDGDEMREHEWRYKRVDYGVDAGISIKLYKFSIGADFDYGLYNVASNVDGDGYNIKNASLSFDLGYHF